jgi:hypothetical protein
LVPLSPRRAVATDVDDAFAPAAARGTAGGIGVVLFLRV